MRSVHIVDYDGTLYRGNSFRDWLAFLVVWGLLTGHLRLVSRIAHAVGKRLVRKGGHAGLKHSVQIAWGERGPPSTRKERWLKVFRKVQRKRIRQDLLDMLQTSDGTFIVASAAPIDYLASMKGTIGYHYLTCTLSPAGEAAWRENIGVEKRDEVARVLKNEELLPARCILYSDHRDDLPLIDLVDEVVLFGRLAAEERAAPTLARQFPNVTFTLWNQSDPWNGGDLPKRRGE
jgi:phosphoserine phosphatase